MNMPDTPYWVRVSVVALMKVATRAQSMDADAPSRAARLPGEPRSPSSARTVASPAVTAVAETQARLVGRVLPPLGSAMAMKRASAAQVSAAAHQVTARIDWRSQSHRKTRAKTSSVTSSGCTTEIAPSCRATAWNRKAPASATHPRSHNGFETR